MAGTNRSGIYRSLKTMLCPIPFFIKVMFCPPEIRQQALIAPTLIIYFLGPEVIVGRGTARPCAVVDGAGARERFGAAGAARLLVELSLRDGAVVVVERGVAGGKAREGVAVSG